MKKIKSLDSIQDIDHRTLTLVQELPFDVSTAIAVRWDGTEATPSVPAEILSALTHYLDYGEGMRGYLSNGCLFVYDWDWDGRTFEERYNRLADKTNAFLRTNGLVALLNAEEIRLSDLAKRNGSQCLIWPEFGEPYFYET